MPASRRLRKVKEEEESTPSRTTTTVPTEPPLPKIEPKIFIDPRVIGAPPPVERINPLGFPAIAAATVPPGVPEFARRYLDWQEREKWRAMGGDAAAYADLVEQRLGGLSADQIELLPEFARRLNEFRAQKAREALLSNMGLGG